MIYNVYNEVVCDYICENCDVSEDCTDRITKNEISEHSNTDCSKLFKD